MEDQQPGAGDLTDIAGDEEQRAETAVATEVNETRAAVPADGGYQPKRRHSFRRRRPNADRAAAPVPDSATPDSEEVTKAAPTDNDDAAAEPLKDGDNTADDTGDTAVESADQPPSTESVEDTEDGGTDEAESSGEAVRARKQAGRWLTVAVLTAASLFVGAAAFAGWAVQPFIADRAAAATKLTIARTAADAITTLWSYTPDNLDHLADRASLYLSGDFEAQYRKFVDSLVAPNKQAQITNSTVITGAAVESLEGPNAVAIVYTNTTSTSPATKNIPSLRWLSYRLFMKQQHARWLVTRMTTITSLDLTPRL